ncbi:MAG: hypothetical protein DHS20C19_29910 [Acidimicrobiales bacterium]|nr:MAG: hypothetical protein DHS20C19_29910 [Acidimicrobiales bacterium]
MNEEAVPEESTESTGLATVVSAAVVAIALIAFIVQNRSDTEVSWLFIDGTWPLWVVIVIAAVAGAVLSEVVGWMLRRRRRNRG